MDKKDTKYFICRNKEELRYMFNKHNQKYNEEYIFTSPLIIEICNNKYVDFHYLKSFDKKFIEAKIYMRNEKLKRINGDNL